MFQESVLTPDSVSKAERLDELNEATQTQEKVVPTPTLDDLVADIRSDACTDPLFYLVRSNTFCDGE